MKVSVGRAVSLMVIGFFLSNLAMFILLSGSNGTYIGAERDFLFRSGCRNVRSFDVRLYILLLLMGYVVTSLVKRGRRSRGARR
ncbi:hypothetical protein [Rossellomorea marisflavi]|uniref:hypothetical protein n=1 Tax=Rossellomorea marisflavi TaxID=189381 RepID=UPI00064EC178|nr:hypothetical protein [Rossellomorea marisflavi]KMK95177.1 hypothetical protein VL03_10475 [Rossellomorea marisflavi]